MKSKKRVKGFSKKNVQTEPIPVEPPDFVEADRAGLERLMEAVLKAGLSPRSCGLLKQLASIPPGCRLALNIKTAMAELCSGAPLDRSYALNREQLGVLQEVEGCFELGDELKRTAYGLFYLPHRKKFVQVFAPDFRTVVTRVGRALTKKPLDSP